MKDLLQAGLEKLSVDYPLLSSPELADKLFCYIQLLEKYNPALGLVSVKNSQDLVVRHILDSLAPIANIHGLLPSGLSFLADAGSGAGLPGIPLALVLKNTHISLIERMGRRCNFLETALLTLGLSHVDVQQHDIEELPPAGFDIITFRAFRPLEPSILKGLFRLLNPGGTLSSL